MLRLRPLPILVALFGSIALLMQSPAMAQSPDACLDAIAIPLGVTSFDSSTATTDGPSPCVPVGSDVWFTFEAPLSSTYRFSLCANTNFDAAMAIYDATLPCSLDPADALGCDDDACGGGGPPIIEWTLTAGEVVRLQVAGWNGASGTGEIAVTDLGSPPLGDECIDALPLAIGTTPFTTVGHSTDGPPACAQIENDRWFLFTAPTDATWRFSLCATTNYDAAMAVYPESAPCPPTSGDALACNDDACGGGGPPIVLIDLTAGTTVRLQVGGWDGASGDGTILAEELPPLPSGANIVVGDLFDMNQFGRVGDEIGCALASTTCNLGAEPLDWFGNPDPRHPFITMAAYRLDDGRLEQIGLSWAKHGFSAAQTDACNFGCTPFPDSTRLGSGCSDIYGSGTNAAQTILGPRAEIDPFTGGFDYGLSILSAPAPSFDATERRLILQDADLDPAAWPNATYFAEVYVLSADDQDRTDSVAWEPITISGSPGGTWSFDTSAPPTVGAAIHAWPGATVVEVADPSGFDGRVYVSSLITDLGGGNWRYEYAIQNLDLAGGIGSLVVPVDPTVTLTDITFHAPEQREIGFDDEPWSFERQGALAIWSTDPAAAATPQNPIRWGALYNFGFTAPAPPVDGLASLDVHEPVGVFDLTVTLTSPEFPVTTSPLFVRGDANQDGSIDIADAIQNVTCLFFCFPPCFDAMDTNDDGAWNIADAIYLLTYLFQNTAPPPAPFDACGQDPSVDPLDCDSFPGCP